MATIYKYLENSVKIQNTITIKNLDDFLNVVKKLSPNPDLIFRGLSRNEQKLPVIMRNNVNLIQKEKEILSEFEKIASLYSNFNDIWDLISLAQHHGLVTRLIDFTSSIFVAAFFSLHKNTDVDEYQIFVANRKEYSNKCDSTVLGIKQELKNIKPYSQDFDTLLFKSSSHRAIIVEPNYSSKRMFAQQGLFIMPIVLSENAINNLYDEMDTRIAIKKEARKDILHFLKVNGFDEFRLMPDLGSACLEINNKYKNEI